MIFEILMSRVIAPYFGNTVYTWGSLIGVILAAMTVGYGLGGKLSSAFAESFLPSLFLILSGILVVVLPFTAQPLSLATQTFDLPRPIATLIVITTLTFLPACLMTTIFPFEAHRMARHYQNVGNLAGHLGIASTIGSLMGTFLASFILVTLPWFGTKRSLLATGILLILCGIWLSYQARELKSKPLSVLLWALVVSGFCGVGYGLSLPLPPLREGETLVEEKETAYHFMRVTEIEGYPDFSQTPTTARILHFSDSLADQSGIWTNLPGKPSTTTYTDLFFLAWAFKPQYDRIAILGAGGGTIPKRILKLFPEETHPKLHVDVVDIDEGIFEMATKHFDYPRQNHRLSSHTIDARMFLATGQSRYDLIFWDLYTNGGQIPEHLVTKEFFETAHSRLSENGVLMVNFFLGHPPQLSSPTSPKFLSFLKTISAVFPEERLHAFYRQKFSPSWAEAPIINRGGITLVAVKGTAPVSLEFEKLTERVPLFSSISGLSLNTLSSCHLTPVISASDKEPYALAPLFTDDFNPISFLRY